MEQKLSALPTMAAQSTPKTMSSRLMTMKFMQRGVASESSSPTTPRSENEGSTKKRRKISHPSSAAAESPSTPLYDQKAVQAALAEEDKKREAAIEKRALELGDARWVLPARLPSAAAASHSPLNVVQVGFAQIDSPAALGANGSLTEERELTAQSQFRRYNMKKSQKRAKPSPTSSADSDSSGFDDDSDESSSPARQDRSGRTPQGSSSESRRRSGSLASRKRKEEQAKALQLAGKRRKKEVKLNQLTSISSSGSSRPGPSSMKCYTCGQAGHRAADCPRKTSR